MDEFLRALQEISFKTPEDLLALSLFFFSTYFFSRCSERSIWMTSFEASPCTVAFKSFFDSGDSRISRASASFDLEMSCKHQENKNGRNKTQTQKKTSQRIPMKYNPKDNQLKNKKSQRILDVYTR